MQVTYRAGTPADLHLVYNSWLKEYRHSPYTRHINSNTYYTQQKQVIDRILAKSLVTIICDPDEPNHIYGYMIFELQPFTIHWLYIKHIYRHFGLASALVKSLFPGAKTQPLQCSHLSKQVSDSANPNSEGYTETYNLFKQYNIEYNPYSIIPETSK